MLDQCGQAIQESGEFALRCTTSETDSPRFRRYVVARADGVGFDVDIAADACSFERRSAVQMVLRGVKERGPIRRRDNLALPDAQTGVPGRVLWYDQAGYLVQIWTDRDGDGRADRVERFENGRRVQVIGE